MAQLQREMSSHEFSEWMAYAGLEPFGEERADLRMGILAALTFNINRDPERTDEAKPEDFIPRFERLEPMSKEDAVAAIDAAFTAYAMMSKEKQ